MSIMYIVLYYLQQVLLCMKSEKWYPWIMLSFAGKVTLGILEYFLSEILVTPSSQVFIVLYLGIILIWVVYQGQWVCGSWRPICLGGWVCGWETLAMDAQSQLVFLVWAISLTFPYFSRIGHLLWLSTRWYEKYYRSNPTNSSPSRRYIFSAVLCLS